MCSNQSLQKKIKQVDLFFFLFFFASASYWFLPRKRLKKKELLPLCTKNGLKIKNNVVTNYKLDILCQISTEDVYKGNVRLSICISNKLMEINVFGGKVKFTPSTLKRKSPGSNTERSNMRHPSELYLYCGAMWPRNNTVFLTLIQKTKKYIWATTFSSSKVEHSPVAS